MNNRQIIVTGASKGIGLSVASELARRGYLPVCLSRSGKGDVGRQVICDMTDESAVRRAFAEIGASGPLVGLVNNAGVHIPGSAATVTTRDFEKTFALNTTAVMVAAREVFPHLRAAGGTIVNIGSFFDKLGVPDNLAYCASKAAVAAMTRVQAVEWAKYGIRVINVAPGYIETDLNREYLSRAKVRNWMEGRIPTGGPGNPEDVARLVAALFNEEIGFLTGETIYVDGAQGINH
ncbi:MULTISPECIES: SDR family NAD(P)-dependent oxidoreductase [Chelativorans]|jgi:NAD(P)-dependent dehydrogenase (short-subunit alcohol dehydrogenase family)|uniref:Short-chain dehydrogenase/reductase SDR n=1 Tax=Chelativorans sp. (strain BNC1) TaxID=266779 RepID=Q11E53_CHESB|nr:MULTISPECIES: SDR family oxidoreductase [Chelativorans]